MPIDSVIGRRPSLGRAAGVGASQMLNSATNLLFQLLLASMLSAARFGVIVVALSVYYLALAVVRAMAGDVLSTIGICMRRRGVVIAACVGAVAGAALAGIALVHDDLRGALAILALAMPLLLVQDVIRYAMWAEGRSRGVLLMDIGRLVLLVLGGAAAVRASSPTLLMASWVVGTLGGLLVLRSSSRRPAEMPTRVQAERAKRLGRGFLGDQLPPVLVAHALPVVLAAAIEPALAGTYRVVFLPFMLAETLLLAARVTILPSLAGPTGAVHRGRLVQVAAAYGAIALVGMVPVFLVAWEPVRDLLGESADGLGARAFLGAAAVVWIRAVGRPFADAVAMARGLRATGPWRGAAALLEIALALASAARWGIPGLLVARFAVGALLTAAYATMALRSPSVPAEGAEGQPPQLVPGSIQVVEPPAE